MDAISSWGKIQRGIKENIGEHAYNRWFLNLQAKEPEINTLVIETPDEFFKNWIIEHYYKIIQELLLKNFEGDIKVEFKINPHLLTEKTQSQNTVLEKNFQLIDKNKSAPNPRFTFENFVTGSSNRFAHAACLAVAESPAKAYNPLFIYGRVGLGKTHLLQAITNKIHENNPKLKYSYLSSEKFTNELIDAIKNRSTNQFRQKYRNIDVLLIDDINFIAGKESTQEEFFHTFNTLHDNRKQIIISSDRPPKEISNLEERLSSRFAWGLITDIQPPDFETRVAILKKKIEREPVRVPNEILIFIAEEIKTNIRELEGALIRVIAYSLLEEKPISLEMAKVILKDMVQDKSKNISIEIIQKNVAEFFNLQISDMIEKKRNRSIVIPRQIAMYLARKLTNLSLPEIGNAFGGKDHTTILHAYKKIETELLKSGELKNKIEKLLTILKQ